MFDKPFSDFVAVVKGAGELASGVAFRLHRAGFQVVMTELDRPSCIARTACFAAAMLEGRKELDGVVAVRAASVAQALAEAREGHVAVLADPVAACAREIRPAVLVDGIMAKRNLGTSPDDAPIVIGLGPGFTAGQDVHAIVETKRGHRLGWVLMEGSAESNTGVPELIDGQSISRMLTAPTAGLVKARCQIGDRVRAGEPIASVASRPVVAAISGIIRGLLPDGYEVESGSTIGEIDPAPEREYCWTLSDRALAVGSGCLAAILELWPKLSGAEELPARARGRRPRTSPGDEILGATEFALLGLLADHPAHGYELSKAFGPEGDLQQVCKVGLSQLYAYLAKLESLGLVAGAPGGQAPAAPRSGGGRPPKKVFAITDAGRRQFEQWLGRPVPGTAYLRVDFMAKLFFARRRPAGELRELLDGQIEVIEQELAELSASRAPGYRAEVAQAYDGFARAGLDWLTSLRAE